MHPIERLRMVARSQSAPSGLLVEEAATALATFRDDPPGMVSACRRIVDRHPTCGPLWWLASRILTSPEPMAEAYASAELSRHDQMAVFLAGAIPEGASVVGIGWPEQSADALRRRGDISVTLVDSDGESEDAVRQLSRMDIDASGVAARNASAAVLACDLVLVEAFAVGPTQALVPAGSMAAALLARRSGIPVWLVAGVGRFLPQRVFDAVLTRWDLRSDPLSAPEEVMGLEVVDRVASEVGLVEVGEALLSTDCPIAPELFRPPI